MPINCPCCGVWMKPTASICNTHKWFKCPSCGHGLLDMLEDTNREYQEHYREHMPTSGDIGPDGKLDIEKYTSNRSSIQLRRISLISEYFEARKSILDVGCGGGYMLTPWKETHTVLGIEVDPLCTDACERQGIPHMRASLGGFNMDGTFDIIMMWHVLEHIVDINTAMKKIDTLMDYGSICIIEIPVKRGLKSRYDGHPHSFTTDSFSALVRRTGYETLRFQDGVQKPAILWVGMK